jgi:hypothetical protein
MLVRGPLGSRRGRACPELVEGVPSPARGRSSQLYVSPATFPQLARRFSLH